MLDIFQSGAGERAQANSLQQKRNDAFTPAGEPGTAEAVRGFAPKFHIEGNRISSAQRLPVTIFRYGTNRRKVRNMIGENHGRKD